MLLATPFLCGCFVTKQTLHTELVTVQLIGIDTIFHQQSMRQQQLTWNTENNIKLITYAPMGNVFVVGTSFLVLMKK